MTTQSTTSAVPGSVSCRRNPFCMLLNLFSSIWFGITLLSLIFIYSAIGSAGLPIRFNILRPDAWVPVREFIGLSEFQWFHWWPFDLLITLLCLSLVTVTVRRIPLNRINAGVWMIHSGIIVLCLGSVWYFGTKVEGDTYIPRRMVEVRFSNGEEARFLATPGNRLVHGSGSNAVSLEVTRIDPDWELLSGDDAGKRTYTVSVRVSSESRTFIRQLLDGYPQYTEDLVRSSDPAQPFVRARKELGHPIVDASIEMSLSPVLQPYFYLMESRALYLRERGSPTWIERPINSMPLYMDRVSDREHVWQGSGETGKTRPMNLAVLPVHPDDPLPDISVIVTDYLRYASLQERRVPGGASLYPTISIRLSRPGEDSQVFDMRAFDPQQDSALDGAMQFDWITQENELDGLARIRRPVLQVDVPGTGYVQRHTLATGDDEQQHVVPGSSYRYRVRSWQDHLVIEGRTVSLAVVEIEHGEEQFTRWVFDQPGLNRDLDVRGSPEGTGRVLDDAIRMTYEPGQASAVRLVGGPGVDRLRLVIPSEGSDPRIQDIRPGVPINLSGDLTLVATEFSAYSSLEERPAIVPHHRRSPDVGMFASMIRLEIPGAANTDAAWLAYHHYPFTARETTIRRFPYQPVRVDLADGRSIELLFSRRRALLPEPVSLHHFRIDSHVGGFSGETSSILDWWSMVVFGAGTEATEPAPVHVNHPLQHAGLWYFQSQWDPPDTPRFEGDPGSLGLNYTVLGVANREGVLVQLLGCIIAVTGMIYAFYVKPWIKRRMRAEVYRTVKQDAIEDSGEAA